EKWWDGYSLATVAAVANIFQFSYRPNKPAQQWVLIVLVIFGAVLYATIVGTISSFAFGLDASGRLYKQKLDEVTDYLRWKNVKEETQKKVLQYYEVKYRGKFFEEEEILGQMNDALRMEIAVHNCSGLINKVPFLRREERDGRDDIFLGRIASALHSNYYVKGDVICSQGESGDAMFFILYGSVIIIRDGKPVATIGPPNFFG
ncbi:Potassium voltage-gated channel sub H member 7, partial [Rhizophlyctis rosea]